MSTIAVIGAGSVGLTSSQVVYGSPFNGEGASMAPADRGGDRFLSRDTDLPYNTSLSTLVRYRWGPMR